MEGDIKRWTALILDIIQGKTTVALAACKDKKPESVPAVGRRETDKCRS